MSPATRRRHRVVEVVRGGWGIALLVAPSRVLATVHGLRVDRTSVVTARILGVRHLTQAVLSGCRPSPEVLAMGIWVDAVHALTALGLAVGDTDRARAGLTDAAVAALWAAAAHRDLTHAAGVSFARQPIRQRLAVAVLSRVPGGRRLLARARAARAVEGE